MKLALIKGDGIGIEVADMAMAVLTAALERCGLVMPTIDEIAAGAGYFADTGKDIEPDGEARAQSADAIFLGAIGLPSVRHHDGTEISPHLRLRDRFGLYAGVRPVKAFPNCPQMLADPRARSIDFVILRESTEGLFYSAAANNRSPLITDNEVRETLSITRTTTEKLHRFAFNLAEKRKARGGKGEVICVDKANVFHAMAFFRQIFFEIAGDFPEIIADASYVDAQALELVRKPWAFDVLVTENMFGDILSDLGGGLIGGMGMAPCAEIGDDNALFQPAHGSAPDIAGTDRANPLAAIMSAAMMLDYLHDKSGDKRWADAESLITTSIEDGFAQKTIRPMEFGGDMGAKDVTAELIKRIKGN